MAQEQVFSFRNSKLQEKRARIAQQREAVNTQPSKEVHKRTNSNILTKEEDVLISQKAAAEEKIIPETAVKEGTQTGSQNENVAAVMDIATDTTDEKTVNGKTEAVLDEAKKVIPVLEQPKVKEAKTAKSVEPAAKAKSVTTKPRVKSDSFLNKPGRKKVYTEERTKIFYNGSLESFERIRKSANWARKDKTAYMCELLENEKKAFEKNPDAYSASRRKKMEELQRAEQGGKKASTFTIGTGLAEFLRDIIYEVEGSQTLYLMAITALDYEKRLKERSK